MEHLDCFDSSDVFIGSYFTDDRDCAHCNREHTLIYICSGELEITDNDRPAVVLRQGDCAFLRRDNRLWMHKRVVAGTPYRSIVLKFSRKFLAEFYNSLDRRQIPAESRRNHDSMVLFPAHRADVTSLFESIKPYFETDAKPSEEILRLKMTEGIYAVLATDKSLYASLFDFVEPWKIDIVDFLERNYMNDLSLTDMACFTGRSLATFKRDFKKVSDLSPRQWIIRRRLQAAHRLIKEAGRRVSDVCFDVGFKNLSHFSKAYKALYGVSPVRHAMRQPV